MKKRDLLLLLLSLTLLVFGAVQVTLYFAGRQAGREKEEDLRRIWRAEETEEIPTFAPVTPTPVAVKAEATPEPEVPAEAPTAAPARLRTDRLRRTFYPDNPGLTVSSRFRDLRKENKDIIGWLTVGKMIDEAVVQRDNEYYMDHDVSGRKNAAGAVFLDQLISLRTRPNTLVLYGHNMRDQSRFGWLRKYEDEAFYRENRIISFNTLYEEGDYVVFSEGTVSTEMGDAHYLDFLGLDSLRLDERMRALAVLQEVNVLKSDVDVRADDQLLVFVTCVEKDTERRVVAARRLRADEEM